MINKPRKALNPSPTNDIDWLADPREIIDKCVLYLKKNVRELQVDWVASKCVLTSSYPEMLSVCISFDAKMRLVYLDIEGVDTAYWNTDEERELDDQLRYAMLALKGEYKYNVSPILKLQEICFRVNGGWHCTRREKNSRYHYMKHRDRLSI